MELLARAKLIYPDAKRVLLTGFADTEAAIQAINEAQIHHDLVKPWDPPERALWSAGPAAAHGSGRAVA